MKAYTDRIPFSNPSSHNPGKFLFRERQPALPEFGTLHPKKKPYLRPTCPSSDFGWHLNISKNHHLDANRGRVMGVFASTFRTRRGSGLSGYHKFYLVPCVNMVANILRKCWRQESGRCLLFYCICETTGLGDECAR